MRRKKINPGEAGARIDFIDESGDSWQEFPVLHPKFKDWINDYYFKTVGKEESYSMVILNKGKFENPSDYLDKESLQKAFEKSPWYGSTANDIDWIRRVEMQSILQKYTTNAISSTINLPSTVTEQEVSDIYMDGWKRGLKGQTVYVDGSRSGVLVSDNKKESNDSFDYRDAVKRPKELEAFAHRSTSKGVKYSVIVGLLDNKPYEIFITEGKAYGNGIIKKIGKGTYKFIKTDKGHEFEEDITAELTDEQAAITRLTSGMLRHGGDVKYIVEQLIKIKGDMFGFTNSLGRVLKKYIIEGSKSTLNCEECGGNNVIFEEGCSKCLDCGNSACS